MMKKLFISCPMKGRTEENIRKSMEKMHKIAEIVFDQKLEVISTYIEDDPVSIPKNSIWYLGVSIKKMAYADYFIGTAYTETFTGCNIERQIAQAYNIPHICIRIEDFMPDAVDIEARKITEELLKCLKSKNS